jgi:hypothetical protein
MAQAVSEGDRSRIGLVVRRTRPVARHAQRFWIAYVVLAIVLGAAAGAAVVASGSKHSSSAPQTSGWSDWRPSGIGSTAVRQIAAHVAPEYRLPNGKQMVNVIAHTPALANGLQEFAISAIEIESDTTSIPTQVFAVGTGVMYILCGKANDCAISPGKATAARGQLVRREALELALNTFRYVDGVQTVIVFLPPVSGSDTRRFVILRSTDVEQLLGVPLRASIGPVRTVKPGSLTKVEGKAVDRASVQHLFQLSQTQQLPDGSLALLVAPESLPAVSI